MILKDYLRIKEISMSRFAKLNGIHHSVLFRTQCGRSVLSDENAEKIERATDGMVSVAEAKWPERFPEVGEGRWKWKMPKSQV